MKVFTWPIWHVCLTQNTCDGRYSQANAHETTWGINNLPSYERKTASVPSAKSQQKYILASWPSSERKQPSDQKMSFYLGGCIDNRDIIPILKGPSNSNSTNSQEQRPAGQLGNKRKSWAWEEIGSWAHIHTVSKRKYIILVWSSESIWLKKHLNSHSPSSAAGEAFQAGFGLIINSL